VLEVIDALELQVVFDQLPTEVVDANPNLLIVVARGLRLAHPVRASQPPFSSGPADVAVRTGDARAGESSRRPCLAHDLVRQLKRRRLKTAGPGNLGGGGS